MTPTLADFIVHPNGWWYCGFCPGYGGKGWAAAHTQKMHRTCPQCGRWFVGLEVHITVAHGTDKAARGIQAALKDIEQRKAELEPFVSDEVKWATAELIERYEDALRELARR